MYDRRKLPLQLGPLSLIGRAQPLNHCILTVTIRRSRTKSKRYGRELHWKEGAGGGEEGRGRVGGGEGGKAKYIVLVIVLVVFISGIYRHCYSKLLHKHPQYIGKTTPPRDIQRQTRTHSTRHHLRKTYFRRSSSSCVRQSVSYTNFRITYVPLYGVHIFHKKSSQYFFNSRFLNPFTIPLQTLPYIEIKYFSPQKCGCGSKGDSRTSTYTTIHTPTNAKTHPKLFPKHDRA